MQIRKLIGNLFKQSKPHSGFPQGGTRVAYARKFPDDLSSSFMDVVKRPEGDIFFRSYDDDALQHLDVASFRRIVLNTDSTASKAHANWVHYINQGWTVTPDYTEQDVVDHPGMRLFEEFYRQLPGEGLDEKIAQISDSLFRDAAAFLELVFDETDPSIPVELNVLDALTAVFRRNTDEVTQTGGVYELGQYQAYSDFVSLQQYDTIEYVPLIPQASNPYGRPTIDAALHFAVQKIRYWKNIRQATESITWPNLLFQIDINKLRVKLGADPNTFQGGPSAGDIEKEIAKIQKNIGEMVQNLQPGGVITHSDDVLIGGPITGQSRQNFSAVPDILKELRIELIDGLLSQPILHGITIQVSETHAEQQMLDYGYTIRNAQNLIAGILTRFHNIILERNGLPPLARFTFKQSITAEADQRTKSQLQQAEAKLKQAEALGKVIEVTEQAVAAGYIDEASALNQYSESVASILNPEEYI